MVSSFGDCVVKASDISVEGARRCASVVCETWRQRERC
jgi:hypothetical protein